jgi:hypothetical protein
MFYGETVCVIRASFVANEVTLSFALAWGNGKQLLGQCSVRGWDRMSLAVVSEPARGKTNIGHSEVFS